MTDIGPRKLLYRIIRGDESAFKSLFLQYYGELLNYAFSITESKFAAEEVVSAVFINLWQHRKKLKNVSNISSYLFVSVKNRSYNYIRDNHQIQIQESHSDKLVLKTTLENPESIYLSEEIRNTLVSEIDKLPERCKLIFRLVREDGMKYKEVAELLDISVKTVETQMGRAISKLKEGMSSHIQEIPLGSFISRLAQIIILIASLQLLA